MNEFMAVASVIITIRGSVARFLANLACWKLIGLSSENEPLSRRENRPSTLGAKDTSRTCAAGRPPGAATLDADHPEGCGQERLVKFGFYFRDSDGQICFG